VLGQEVSSLDDNFFDLRGDSLLAISVLGKIRQQFNVTLNPSDIFTAPTLRQLALLIQPNDETVLLPAVTALPATLVPLSHGGSKPPLFLSPPIMGTLFPYLQLAQSLGKDRPIYGLSLRIPESGSFEWETVEEQARLYINDIKAVQPCGPYLIGGWSFGAVVAFEVVRQLEAQGDKVGFFAAIDYPSQTSSQTSLLDFLRFFGFSTFKNLLSYLRDYIYLRSKSADNKKRSFLSNLIDHAVIGKVLSPEAQQQFAEQPGMQELMQFYRANTVALSKYRPTGTYQGTVDLYRTDDHNMNRHNHSLEWETATSGKVNVHIIGGTHMTILRSPHVEQLSAEIKMRLDETDDSSRSTIAISLKD
jgi:thioesterase domain-containing protein/acyl carrier protein